MKTNELRLFNWVHHKNRNGDFYLKVESIGVDSVNVNHNGVWELKLTEINPIPLTPEVLRKAGFESVDVGNEYYENYIGPRSLYISKCLTVVNGGWDTVVGEYYMGEYHTHIPNLHWLQNYVFFNYKFELEIEL